MTLVYSIFRYTSPFYPGTGLSDECGGRVRYNHQCAFIATTGYETYERFRQVMAPAADRFDPQLILFPPVLMLIGGSAGRHVSLRPVAQPASSSNWPKLYVMVG
jgi:hypothetical protein